MSKQSDIDYLVSKGLPEVYAYMAVKKPSWHLYKRELLSEVIRFSFKCLETRECIDFWCAIHENAMFLERV